MATRLNFRPLSVPTLSTRDITAANAQLGQSFTGLADAARSFDEVLIGRDTDAALKQVAAIQDLNAIPSARDRILAAAGPNVDPAKLTEALQAREKNLRDTRLFKDTTALNQLQRQDLRGNLEADQTERARQAAVDKVFTSFDGVPLDQQDREANIRQIIAAGGTIADVQRYDSQFALRDRKTAAKAAAKAAADKLASDERRSKISAYATMYAADERARSLRASNTVPPVKDIGEGLQDVAEYFQKIQGSNWNAEAESQVSDAWTLILNDPTAYDLPTNVTYQNLVDATKVAGTAGDINAWVGGSGGVKINDIVTALGVLMKYENTTAQSQNFTPTNTDNSQSSSATNAGNSQSSSATDSTSTPFADPRRRISSSTSGPGLSFQGDVTTGKTVPELQEDLLIRLGELRKLQAVRSYRSPNSTSTSEQEARRLDLLREIELIQDQLERFSRGVVSRDATLSRPRRGLF